MAEISTPGIPMGRVITWPWLLQMWRFLQFGCAALPYVIRSTISLLSDSYASCTKQCMTRFQLMLLVHLMTIFNPPALYWGGVLWRHLNCHLSPVNLPSQVANCWAVSFSDIQTRGFCVFCAFLCPFLVDRVTKFGLFIHQTFNHQNKTANNYTTVLHTYQWERRWQSKADSRQQ